MADGTQAKEVATVEQSPRANGLQSVRVVHDAVAAFDTGKFEHMQRLAAVLANSSLVPEHLKGKGGPEALANCFLVVNQAHRWHMDPFAVAQATFVTRGRIGYEGKLVAAALAIRGIKLATKFEGKEGTPQRRITLWDPEDPRRDISGTVEQWQTRDKEGKIQRAWHVQPDDQLIYRGTRQWCRRHEPGVILGVYTPDELEAEIDEPRDITPKGPPPAPKRVAQSIATAQPFPAPDKYIDHLAGEFEIVDDALVEEVWEGHLESSDGRLPREHQERAKELYEKRKARIKPKAAAEGETMQLPMRGNTVKE